MIKMVSAKNSAPIKIKNRKADNAVVMNPKTAKTGFDWIAIRIREANITKRVALMRAI